MVKRSDPSLDSKHTKKSLPPLVIHTQLSNTQPAWETSKKRGIKNSRYQKFLCDMTEEPSNVFSSERLDTAAKEARLNKFIPILDLVYIMADEEKYIKDLPILWKFFELYLQTKIETFQPDIKVIPGLEIQNNPDLEVKEQNKINIIVKFIPSKNIDWTLKTKEERATLWFHLLEAWAIAEPPYIYFYRYRSHFSKFEKLKRYQIRVNNVKDCVELDEFRMFLLKLAENLEIDFSLPYILYPPKVSAEPEKEELSNDNVEKNFQEPEISELMGIPFEIKKHENVFCRKGDLWIIKFNKNYTMLQDNKYNRYIPHLLERPGEMIKVNDLYDLVNGKNVDSTFSVEEENELSSSDLTIEVLSQDELAHIKQEGNKLISGLNKAKETGDTEQIKDAEEQIKDYRKYLLKEFSIFTKISQNQFYYTKKKHRTSPENEKVRKNVSIQIKKAYKKIGEVLPELCLYLKSHIKIGNFCSYIPDRQKPIEWLIKYS